MYRKYGEEWPCWYYTDYHVGHGRLNVSQAIERSCNYFFYETGDRMGIETLAKYARYFGLGVFWFCPPIVHSQFLEENLFGSKR